MGFIDKIRTVARFEMKTLFRSWFFRIFSVLTLLMLLGVNIGMLTEGGTTNWIIKSVSSNIPYMNMAFLNVAQALLAIFLASDFLKRDKKLDTTEVIYVRSMSNWEYVWGKTLGVLIVFTVLNILVLLMAFIINLVVAGVEVDYMAYLIYPLIIGIPTLIFTLGLAFVLMSAIKNQAVTLVVLLGLAAVSLFFVQGKVNNLFDYMVFSYPLMWSDIIGSGNLQEILLHRGIYLFIGLGSIFATILLLKRLPQSRLHSIVSMVLTAGFLFLGFAGGFVYWSNYNAEKSFRDEVRTLNNQIENSSISLIESYDLDLKHEGETIVVKAKLELDSETKPIPSKMVFSLNPGLEIKSVSINGSEVEYQRNVHLIEIAKPTNVTGAAVLEIDYAGEIDERICYLDLSDDDLSLRHAPDYIISSQKRYGIIEDDYVLLTPESVWYPVSGGTFGSRLSKMPVKQFSEYSLKVEAGEGQAAISQGKSEQSGNSWNFSSETPYHGISLMIGNYETKVLDLDSLKVELNYLAGHDAFLEPLDLMGDTLPYIVRETLEDYERGLGLSYPFDFIKLVEAPVQFFAYNRVWSQGYDYVQPGMIIYPENLSFLKRGNLSREYERAIDRAIERDEMSTDLDLQIGVFNNLIKNNFIKGQMDFRMMMRGGGRMSFSSSDETPWSLFPNYFQYVNNFVSDDYQMIDAALESYIGSELNSSGGFGQSFGGIQDAEKANMSLMESSFKDLLAKPDDKMILPVVIESKGKQLFNYLEASIGSAEFVSFMSSELEASRFTNLKFTAFVETLKSEFDLDISSFMNDWFSNSEVSSFIVTGVKNFEIQEGDNTVYQLFFTISNTGNTEGLVNITFRTGGRGGRGGFGRGGGGGSSPTTYALAGRDESNDRLYIIPPNTAYRVGLIMDEQVRMMTVNTMISKNLPASIMYPFPDVEKSNISGFEGSTEVDLVTTLAQPNELVVDNEDRGFTVHEEGSSNRLSGILGIDQKDSDFKYQGMWFWRPPMNWALTTNSGYYGDYIRSAYYTRSGDGERSVEWEVEIPEAGYYSVSVYLDDMLSRMGRNRGRGGDRGGKSGGSSNIKDVYHYVVSHDEGVDEINKALSNIEDGWNILGSFYFSEGC